MRQCCLDELVEITIEHTLGSLLCAPVRKSLTS
jgi:hypothetical protein